MMTVVLFCLARIADDEFSKPFLLIYAWCFLFASCAQRFKRWRERCQGRKQHSFYVGDSIMERLPWPCFMKRERRVARFVEPAAVGLAGFLIMRVTPIFGLWLLAAALALRVFEDAIYRRDRQREMDMVDAIIDSQVHVEVVERYAAASPVSNVIIPTGMAPDIQDAIRHRRMFGKDRSGS